MNATRKRSSSTFVTAAKRTTKIANAFSTWRFPTDVVENEKRLVAAAQTRQTSFAECCPSIRHDRPGVDVLLLVKSFVRRETERRFLRYFAKSTDARERLRENVALLFGFFSEEKVNVRTDVERRDEFRS